MIKSDKYIFPLTTASKMLQLVSVSISFLDWMIAQDAKNKQGLFSERWNQMECHDALHAQFMFDGL